MNVFEKASSRIFFAEFGQIVMLMTLFSLLYLVAVYVKFLLVVVVYKFSTMQTSVKLLITKFRLFFLSPNHAVNFKSLISIHLKQLFHI